MDDLPQGGSNQSALPQTYGNQLGSWVTVSEAVTYCSMKGLNRTPKTIRKWALRSHQDSDNAELEVRREDIETGFRWSIERTSLERKIIQELEFENRNQVAQRRSGAPYGEPVHTPILPQTKKSTNLHHYAPVQTSSAEFATHSEDNSNFKDHDDNDDSELVQSLRDQIRRLDEQVDFYREELRDRRTSTQALAEVIQAFRLNAENQNSRSQSSGGHHDIREPRRNDVGDNDATNHSQNGL